MFKSQLLAFTSTALSQRLAASTIISHRKLGENGEKRLLRCSRASVVPGTIALIRRIARTLHGGQGNKGWETAVLAGQVTPLWVFTHTSLKRGCRSLPLGLLGHLWVCAGAVEGLASEGRSLPPPPTANRTCSPNNTGSPTARLPQRPREAASAGAVAEAGLTPKHEDGMGGKAASASCSHPVGRQPREHIWILTPQLRVHQALKNTDRQFHYSSLWQGPLKRHLSVLLENHEMWEWSLAAWGWTWLCGYDPQRLPFSFRPSFRKTPNSILCTLLWTFPKEMTHYSENISYISTSNLSKIMEEGGDINEHESKHLCANTLCMLEMMWTVRL